MLNFRKLLQKRTLFASKRYRNVNFLDLVTYLDVPLCLEFISYVLLCPNYEHIIKKYYLSNPILKSNPLEFRF